MPSYWIISEDEDNLGTIEAETRNEAEVIHFEGILNDKYPLHSMLVEQMEDDEDCEPLDDEDIISTEYLQ